MPIVVHLDIMLAKRKMSLTELSNEMGFTVNNMSILKSGKAQGIRFNTLDLLCNILECQPGDLLEHVSMIEYKKLFRR